MLQDTLFIVNLVVTMASLQKEEKKKKKNIYKVEGILKLKYWALFMETTHSFQRKMGDYSAVRRTTFFSYIIFSMKNCNDIIIMEKMQRLWYHISLERIIILKYDFF
uniref:Uncharacterized protein n=1 Tax=Cacopsylla melanoneura TaxID=428564 RepID=A0A8D8PX50_9HEMI